MHVESLARDIRYAWRALVRRPLFAIVTVTTIGVGLAATTLAFAVVNALFFKGAAGTELPGFGAVVTGAGSEGALSSFREYEAFARDVPSLEVAAAMRVPLSHRGPAGAETLWSLAVSRNYFALIEARAERGRLFESAANDKEGRSGVPGGDRPSAVVSHRFWRESLQRASPAGLTVTLNGQEVAVIGVLPDDHRDPGGFYDPSVWIRLDDWDALALPRKARDPSSRLLGLPARLRGSATRALAQQEVSAVARELERAWPATNAGRAARFVPFGEGNAEMQMLTTVAATAMIMVGLVLLIAIFNLAGLLLARAVDRQREMSLRTAIGASRLQIVRQLVVESLVIATLGASAAVVVSMWAEPLLASFAIPAPIPQRLNVTPDAAVVAFVAGGLLVSGLVAGLIPARRAMRLGLTGVTSASAQLGGHDRSRLRIAVVSLQVAGATTLLTAAGVFVRGAVDAGAVDVGFEHERAVLVELDPVSHGYDVEGAARLTANVQDALRGLPGVRHVSMTDRLPFYVGFPARVDVSIDGRSCALEDCPTAGSYRVGPQYFQALEIPITRGREFDLRSTDADAVVVSETMARQFAPGGDLLGRWIVIGPDGERRQVVGVAADVLHRSLRERPEPYLYLPMATATFEAPVTVVVATTNDPGPLVAAVRDRVHALDRDLPIRSIQTMRQRLDDRARRGEGLIALFFTTCGSLALFLSAVGLAGTVSYAAGQRTREFGVRAAMGAEPDRLRRLVLRDGLTLALPGIAAGLCGAVALMQIIGTRVPSVGPGGPGPYVLTAVVQLAIVLGASALPGRRAARANPLAILRGE